MSMSLGAHGRPSTAKADCGMASAIDGQAKGRSMGMSGPGTKRGGPSAGMPGEIRNGAFSDGELQDGPGTPVADTRTHNGNRYPGQ